MLVSTFARVEERERNSVSQTPSPSPLLLRFLELSILMTFEPSGVYIYLVLSFRPCQLGESVVMAHQSPFSIHPSNYQFLKILGVVFLFPLSPPVFVVSVLRQKKVLLYLLFYTRTHMLYGVSRGNKIENLCSACSFTQKSWFIYSSQSHGVWSIGMESITFLLQWLFLFYREEW